MSELRAAIYFQFLSFSHSQGNMTCFVWQYKQTDESWNQIRNTKPSEKIAFARYSAWFARMRENVYYFVLFHLIIYSAKSVADKVSSKKITML